ncbi:MAG: hypothetical protein KJS95_08470 [Gammaproteobacteria bacterium]|nr:hypothetical protein [Gammaproteobacteria bacterium]
MSKIQYLAPIAVTTAAVTAFIAVKIDDARFKKILNGIAGVLFMASIVAFANDLLTVYEHYATTERRVAEERARAAVAIKEAKDAELRATEAAQLASERTKRLQLEQEALVRQLEDEKRLAKLRIEQAEAAERAAIARARSDEQALKQQMELKAQEQRRQLAEAQRGESVRRAEFCDSCCRRRAPAGYPYAVDKAISTCIDECQSGKPSNWFGNNVVMCRQ